MHHILEHGERPKTMFSFAKQAKLKEQELYAHFTSFDSIEKSIFSVFFENTMEVLTKNDDYVDFESKDKLLSFYYTFFEMLTANRSYVLFALSKGLMHPKTQSQLSLLKQDFQKFVSGLEISTMDIPNKKLNEFQEKSISHLGWSHLTFVLDFWMKDVSPGFEKTDILIEKSVNTGMHLANSQPVKDVIDLGKFLYKEITQR